MSLFGILPAYPIYQGNLVLLIMRAQRSGLQESSPIIRASLRLPTPICGIISTNLTRSEIFALEYAGFQLPPKEHITPTRLFTNSAPPLDMSGIRILEFPDFIPPKRLSKVVQRSNSAPFVKQRQMVVSGEAMHGTVLKSIMIPYTR
jgi:hypothetical protein